VGGWVEEKELRSRDKLNQVCQDESLLQTSEIFSNKEQRDISDIIFAWW
jgi:hypothetical protein